MAKKKKRTVDGYNERHLAAMIRRKMIQKEHGIGKKYTRKTKHKNDEE